MELLCGRKPRCSEKAGTVTLVIMAFLPIASSYMDLDLGI
jgi:hypothetical protein